MVHPKRNPAADAPLDVRIKKGRVMFGLRDHSARGIEAVILPVFDIRGCTFANLLLTADKINTLTKRFQDSYCESLVRKKIGDMGTRVLINDGNLVALDEDAATMLHQMRFPIRTFRHYVPI
jgi:hypothetical protein